MADLLPSTPDLSAAEEPDPRVVGVDSDDADDLIGALSSSTARQLLAALHDEPANPAKLADRVDTTIQNAQYHLGKLEDAGLIEVIDTAYSEKGREMQVYAPSDRPLVVVAGGEDETTGLRAALSRLLGALGALGLSSLLVEQLVGEGFVSLGGMGSAGGGGDGGEPRGIAGGDGGDGGDAGSDGGLAEQPTESPSGAGGGADNATGTPTEARMDTPAGTETPAPTGEATGTPSPPPEGTPTPAAEPTTTAADGAAATPTRTPVELATDVATETVREPELLASFPPGLVFFAGGATVLLAGFALWYVRR